MANNLVTRYQAKFGIKSRLRGYQLQAANLGVRLDSYALLMSPRLGKTRVDVAVAGYRFLNDGLARWVIICPVIAMDVWRQEIENSLAIPYELEILEGKSLEKRAALRTWRDKNNTLSIVIMNFEATWRIKKFLYKFNPGKVSVDESHRIKNHSSNQSKCIHNLGKRATYRCILTGTFMSKPTDAFSQYKFLDPAVFGTVYKDSPRKRQPNFLSDYVATYGYGGHKPETYKNLDRLNEKIQSRAFMLTRAQAGGFPQEQEETIHFNLTNPALKHYREMEEELRTMVQGHRVNAEIVLTQILRLQQITGGFLPVKKPDEDQATNVPLGSDRIRALMDLIDQYPVGEPLVIFAKFRYEVASILTALKKVRTANYLVGGMKKTERDLATAQFQSGKYSTIVAQVRTGISIDLSRADTAIFYSATSHLDYEQAMARIIARTGGRKSFLKLSAKDTVDDDIWGSTAEKIDLVSQVLQRLTFTS